VDEVDRPVPRVCLRVEEETLGTPAAEIVARLRRAEPPVWVQPFRLHEGVLILNPVCLLEGDEELVVQALREVWRQLGQ
jgi:hypothetical protein